MLTAGKLTIAEGTQAYSRLRAEVIDAGILERSYFYYFCVISLTVLGFALSMWAIFALHNYLYRAGACLVGRKFRENALLAGVSASLLFVDDPQEMHVRCTGFPQARSREVPVNVFRSVPRARLDEILTGT